MKKFLLLTLILLVGCTPPANNILIHSRGHWGDRSDWRSANFVQDYFADSDSHLVGWIIGKDDSVSFEGHCQFVLDGQRYETPEAKETRPGTDG